MTAVSVGRSTPPALAAYLRRATWGLPAARRQEIWDELEEHVLERTDHLCAFGKPFDEALRQAVTELGPPAKVSAGMSEVYLMPKVLIAACIVGLTASALWLAAAGSTGNTVQLPVLLERPVKPSCVKGSEPSGSMITVVSRKNGVTCYIFNDKRLYSGAFVSLNDLSRVFNANGIRASVNAAGDLEVHYPNGAKRILSRYFIRKGQGYTDATDLVISTIREPVTPELQLTGYDNPTLSFGQLQLVLGDKTAPVRGDVFYEQMVPTLIGVLTSPDPQNGWDVGYSGTSRSSNDAVTLPRHVIQTDLSAGEVVALISRRSTGGNTFDGDVAPVGKNGQVTLYNEHKTLRFVGDPSMLNTYSSGGRTNALLIRLTNIPLRNLKSGIFKPASPTSDAR